MRQSEELGSEFAGDKLNSTDEKELDDKLKSFDRTLKHLQKYAKIYEALTGILIDTEEIKHKAEHEIENCYDELSSSIKRLDENHDEKSLRSINRRLIILKSAGKSEKTRDKQGKAALEEL